jgi:hypothetical protein
MLIRYNFSYIKEIKKNYLVRKKIDPTIFSRKCEFSPHIFDPTLRTTPILLTRINGFDTIGWEVQDIVRNNNEPMVQNRKNVTSPSKITRHCVYKSHLLYIHHFLIHMRCRTNHSHLNSTIFPSSESAHSYGYVPVKQKCESIKSSH